MDESSASPPDEPDDASPGMGPTPRGPTFQTWPIPVSQSPSRPVGLSSPPRPPPCEVATFGPASSRGPTLITAAVVLLIALVVLAATLVANRADRLVTGPSPQVRPSSPTSQVLDNSIEFTAGEGSGRLVVLRHSWATTGIRPPKSGRYLRVEVELICTEGRLSYDPYVFQVFDANGILHGVAQYGDPTGQLVAGTLGADERVRGSVAFDLPRGDVTLLMTDDTNQAITALKISD